MRYALQVGAVTLIMLLISGCKQQPARVELGPDAKADLVVVLRDGLSRKQVNSFLSTALITGQVGGPTSNRPGVASIVKVTIGSHSAYAVTFLPYATLKERQMLKKGIQASGYIYKLFEDVAPENIDLGG